MFLQKRGLIILCIGLVLILISFSIAATFFSDADLNSPNAFLLPDLLGDIFDHVTDESVLYPGDFTSFTYDAANQGVPLMWGLQITDYQDDTDTISINISNIFGDNFGSVTSNEPIIFDTFVVEQSDVYNFDVENTGNRPITVVMMFIEDPENSETLQNSDSPFITLILPLAISGIFLIVGILVTISGVIILILDWKKEKRPSSNNNGY